MTRKRLFGELEWMILELVKEKREASVKEICDALDQSVVYTTIMTVMSRLAAKGDLERKKVGRQYIYQLPKKQGNTSLGLVEKLKQRLFGGRSAAMIRYLIDSGEDLTQEDLKEMESLLKKAREIEK